MSTDYPTPPPPPEPPQSPFTPPDSFPDGGGGMDRGAAMNKVSGPAIGLMVTGGLGILSSIYSMLMGGSQQAMFQDLYEQEGMEDMLPFLEMMQSLNIVFVGLGLAVSIFIIFAALKMKKLESFGMSMAGSIIAMVPCFSPCCIVGLPIGIWALIQLNKPEIKEAFE